MHESRLPHRSGGLFLGDGAGPLFQSQLFPSGGYGPGRDYDDYTPLLSEVGDLGGDPAHDSFIKTTVFAGEDAAADLDNNPFDIVEEFMAHWQKVIRS
jgi:hypothetical protein